MAKEVKKFIEDSILKMTDDEIRLSFKEKIGVFYGFNTFNNYECNLKHVNELREYVLKDYPNTSDKDIEVWWIKDTQSIRHARFTMLYIAIPTEDFIKLKAEGQIYIL